MLRSQVIPAAEWLPDLSPYDNPGTQYVKNVIPTAVGYRPLRGLRPFGAIESGEAPLGSIWAQDDSFNYLSVVGTATRLLLFDAASSAWTNISKAGNYSGITHWEFARFGFDLIAVAPGLAPQVADLTATSPAFADLGGSPPNAKRIAIVRSFVVFGDLDSDPNAIAWSGANNATIWGNPDLPSLSARQTLYEHGRVQRIVPGVQGIIFQEDAIRVMRFTGRPTLFAIDVIARGIGTLAGDSVCWNGQDVFFYAQDGFKLLRGGQVLDIGREKVDRWFLDNSSAQDRAEMRGIVDKTNQTVLWSFKSNAGISQNDRVLIFHYPTQRWSWAEIDTSLLAEYRTSGLTLDDLTSVLSNGIDQDSFNIDSPAFKGGQLSVIGFDNTGVASTLTGDFLKAEIDTKEFDGGNQRRVYVSSARPLLAGSPQTTVAVRSGGRNTFTEAPSFRLPRALDRTGRAPLRDDRRYMRIRTEIEGEWEHYTGIEVEGRPSGKY